MCMFVYVHACVCLCVYACMCVCVCVSGSEKLQPDRIYVLGSKRELSDGQKLAPPDGTAQETHHLVSF